MTEQRKYFPIGTVVTLIDGIKPLMIYGRAQKQKGSDAIFDYVACLYPEGNLSSDFNIFFQHKDVGEVLFTGYQTEEDEKYQVLMCKSLQGAEQVLE